MPGCWDSGSIGGRQPLEAPRIARKAPLAASRCQTTGQGFIDLLGACGNNVTVYEWGLTLGSVGVILKEYKTEKERRPQERDDTKRETYPANL
jgi:hypothetical protein